MIASLLEVQARILCMAGCWQCMKIETMNIFAECSMGKSQKLCTYTVRVKNCITKRGTKQEGCITFWRVGASQSSCSYRPIVLYIL